MLRHLKRSLHPQPDNVCTLPIFFCSKHEMKKKTPLATVLAEGVDLAAPSYDRHRRSVPSHRSRPPANSIAASGVDHRRGVGKGASRSSSMGSGSYKQPKPKPRTNHTEVTNHTAYERTS